MSTQQRDNLNDIAIIGMDGRFPGASNLEDFWRNLSGGVESITFYSNEPPVIRNGMAHVKAAPWLDDIELFDAGFFGFNPREAETMDPQIRLFLECGWTALERAGCDSAQYPGRIGVFAGCASSSYLMVHLLPNPEVMRRSGGAFSSLGQFNDRDSLSTIVSYKFDLSGPSLTVQTFCSTSLVAVHLACQSLLNGESDMALAGAASINVSAKQGYVYVEGGIVSPDGHCRAFDEKAAGTIFGSGVGVVVLKRMADALDDGDVVHAVIRGSAVNNDGAQKAGYTAPSVVGQSKAIAEALALAQVDPEAVSYVETHGTGTALGDPIEIEALTRAFRSGTEKTGFCPIGSAKTNFGHLDRAAGVASLIKTVLALKHRQIPPSLHYEKPNPKIDFEKTPFYVNTRLQEWKADAGARIAGVSSLGFGGTNAHVVLEEAPPRRRSGPSRRAQMLVLSAKTEPALEKATALLVDFLKSHPDRNLGDVALTLQVGRRRMEHRRFVVCGSAEDGAAALEAVDPKRVATGHSQATERPVVFMFPGQGAQYVGMTRGLYEEEPEFKRALDDCCRRLRGELGFDLEEILFAREDQKKSATERLRQTEVTQPALFAVEYALAKLWMSWGVEPAAMIGHSIGEYVAAHLAGVISLEDSLALVAERGRLMQSMPGGSMLAVAEPSSRVEALLTEELSLAAVNAPSLSAVSGPTPAVDALEKHLQSRDIFCSRLHTSHAFHSAMMDPILEEFAARVRAVKLGPPELPFVSNLTGTWISDEEAVDPSYWVKHLRHTVRFSQGIQTLWSKPERILLEVGPGNTLTSLAKQHAGTDKDRVALSSIRHPRDETSDADFLLGALGQLWLAGAAIDFTSFYRDEDRQRVELPTYPFERERYWIDVPSATDGRARYRGTGKNPDVTNWFYMPTWKSALPARIVSKKEPAGEPGRWLVFVEDHGLGERLVERMRRMGESVVTVCTGAGFKEDSRDRYFIDPGSKDDYTRLVKAVSNPDHPVTRIVHGWSVGPRTEASPTIDSFGEAQERGYYSLFYLIQAVGEEAWTQPITIKILSSQMHTVLSDDVAHPERITLLAMAKVIPQEYHNMVCSSIDVEPTDVATWANETALDPLIHELRAAEAGSVVAYRKGQRWARGFEPVRLPRFEGKPAGLRERGVYLITGGLGGVTFVLAAYLARSVNARLVLTGRTPMPERRYWETWLGAHGEGDSMSVKMRRVLQLEKWGAEVSVVRADTGSPEEMRAAVEQAESRFGEIHGVIHGAGIVGGDTFRPIQQIGREECEQQFYPKVHGLLALEEALRGKKLDFFHSTSSLSSVLGGFAYGAYAAANLFLDAYTEYHNRQGDGMWSSINWDEWRLSSEPSQGPGGESGLRSFAMAPHEGAEAFSRLLHIDGVPQVVVSTGDLEYRMDQWIRLEALRGPKKDEKKEDSAPRHARPNLQSAYVAPGTATEKRVAALWQDLLGVEKVGIHDNFFELGGHSLLAIQVITRIRTELKAEVSVASLFEGPTVQSLSRIIGDKSDETASYEHSSQRGKKRREARKQRRLEKQGTHP